MKNISILGSTGSIGTQTLDIVRANDDLNVVAIAAGSNIKALEEQVRNSILNWFASITRKQLEFKQP